MKELALWGLPKGETDALHAVVLLGGPRCTPENIEKVKAIAAKDGFHSFTVQVIDLSVAPDFTKGIRG